jgi:hypothetical protein
MFLLKKIKCAFNKKRQDKVKTLLRIETSKSQCVDGDTYWVLPNGQLHRRWGPAHIVKNLSCWYINGKRHRNHGPALEYQNDRKELVQEWYCHGQRHRIDGPAYINLETNKQIYYRDDQEITQLTFETYPIPLLRFYLKARHLLSSLVSFVLFLLWPIRVFFRELIDSWPIFLLGFIILGFFAVLIYSWKILLSFFLLSFACILIKEGINYFIKILHSED